MKVKIISRITDDPRVGFKYLLQLHKKVRTPEDKTWLL